MSKSKKSPAKAPGLTFEDLVRSIREVNRDLAIQAKRAVNANLTLRNWIFGCYIVEYEQRGADRARYGEKLLAKLSVRLVRDGVSRAEERELRRYRRFYLAYPQIREALSPESRKSLSDLRIGPDGPIRETVSPEFGLSGKEVITRLSFSHFVELLAVEDPLKRSFYEAECIRGNWDVRGLKRQIASLYFERSALSHDKAKLASLTHAGAEPAETRLTIRDPYVFEVRHDNRVSIADSVSRILGRRYLNRPTYLGSKDDRDNSLLVKRWWATKCPDPRAARFAKHGEGYTA